MPSPGRVSGAAHDDPLTGRALADRYELREAIGSGGMGRIYLAWHLRLHIPVVVKVLQPELAASPHAAGLFRGEGLLLGRLTHPNVVTILDFGQTDDGLLYMVMEHVNGPSLRELVRDGGPQPTAVVLSLAQQLLAALEAVHAAGIVHGDVTPYNLMVSFTNDGVLRLKLIDFGLARLLEADGAPAREPDQVCGTPGYMAPEVFRGGLPTIASDLYSAAVVIQELLTGETSRNRATQPMGGQRRATGSPMPAALMPGPRPSPSRLRSWIERAMTHDPALRCTAAELLAGLMADGEGKAPPSAPTIMPRGSGHPDERLREAIGRALRLGDLDHTVELYLGLATMLRGAGDPAAALSELAEALDIVTLGAGAGGSVGPVDTWRLLLLAGDINARADAAGAARLAAAAAHRHARRVSSKRGVRDSARLLRELQGSKAD